MRAENGWLRNVKVYFSSWTGRASRSFFDSFTVKAPSTGQSSFGVNLSSRSFVQNHVPANGGRELDAGGQGGLHRASAGPPIR